MVSVVGSRIATFLSDRLLRGQPQMTDITLSSQRPPLAWHRCGGLVSVHELPPKLRGSQSSRADLHTILRGSQIRGEETSFPAPDFAFGAA